MNSSIVIPSKSLWTQKIVSSMIQIAAQNRGVTISDDEANSIFDDIETPTAFPFTLELE